MGNMTGAFKVQRVGKTVLACLSIVVGFSTGFKFLSPGY